MRLTICLDVGGTFIKGMVFNEISEELIEGINYYPSKAEMEADDITENFVYIIQDLYSQVIDEEKIIDSIFLAFPGPFDYANGISLIKNLGKYDKIYNFNLKKHLSNVLSKTVSINISNELIIEFFNDATSFAFGEYSKEKIFPKKAAFFTLGTGCGSTFIDKGKIIKGNFGIPDSGMIFNEKFADGIIDDYISARGFNRLVENEIGDCKSPVEIFNLAKMGDDGARRVFRLFGKNIGKALVPYIISFRPNVICFGGQISKGFVFMEAEIRKAFDFYSYKLIVSKDTSYSTIRGLYYLKTRGDEYLE